MIVSNRILSGACHTCFDQLVTLGVPPVKKKTKWNKHIDAFILTLAARRDKKTVQWYAARLKHWLEFTEKQPIKVKKVTASYLDKYFGHLARRGLAYSTRQGNLTALKCFFKYLHQRKKLSHDPFVDFEPLAKERIEPAIISLTHAYQMIRAAEAAESTYGIRDAAIMRLLLSTGARREEVVRLKLAWVDLGSGILKLKGKYKHERSAFLISSTRLALERWYHIRPDGPATVFTALHPSRPMFWRGLQPTAINDLLVRWAGRAAVPDYAAINPHAWRHRFATEMANSGDPFRLQYLMGHADISTTNQYIHKNPELLRNMVIRFAPEPPDQT